MERTRREVAAPPAKRSRRPVKARPEIRQVFLKIDDAAPPSEIKDYERDLALATALQGIGEATVAVHSKEPAAVKARDELEKKFRAETAESPPGDLWRKFDGAMYWSGPSPAAFSSPRQMTPFRSSTNGSRSSSNSKRATPMPATSWRLLFGREQIEIRLDRCFGDRERRARKRRRGDRPLGTVVQAVVRSGRNHRCAHRHQRGRPRTDQCRAPGKAERRPRDLPALTSRLPRASSLFRPRYLTRTKLRPLLSKVCKKLSLFGVHKNSEPSPSKDRQNNDPLLFQDRHNGAYAAGKRADEKEIFAGVWLTETEEAVQANRRSDVLTEWKKAANSSESRRHRRVHPPQGRRAVSQVPARLGWRRPKASWPRTCCPIAPSVSTRTL